MNNAELNALAAVVNHETMFMAAVNQMRTNQGYQVAYVEPSENFFKLLEELDRRLKAIAEVENEKTKKTT